MFDTMRFLVRSSGTHDGQCYIDYCGAYKTADIAKQTKIPEAKLQTIYTEGGGVLDEKIGVYYFDTAVAAQAVITRVLDSMKSSVKGRAVVLTEGEIECIRRALISDGAVPFGINAKIKDSILKKLNG